MRLTDLPILTTASLQDVLYIVDVSDTSDFLSGSSKQITVSNFLTSSGVLGSGGGTGAGFPFSGSAVITGSLLVTQYISASVSGTLHGTSSWSINSLSSSYANSSSYSLTASYLLNPIPFSEGTLDAQTFVAEGFTSSYLLTRPVTNSFSLLVCINGVLQNYSSSYSITGSTINFVENVPSGSLVDIRYLAGMFVETSSYALTASYALNGGGGAGFPFSGSAVITGSLTVTDTITINNNTLSSSNGTLYINNSPIKPIQIIHYSASISSSTNVYLLNIRNDFLQGRYLINGNIYVDNLSGTDNAYIYIYNTNNSDLIQSETIGPNSVSIFQLSDVIPLAMSGSGYFELNISASVI